MKQLDLFAGIGGISLAAEWAGIETIAFCEKESFCQKVLRARFPGRPIYDDVFDLTAEVLRKDGIDKIDIVSGGFPCQPFSHAGKRTGTADDRYLWPEMLRIIGEIKPSWVVAENVEGLISMAQSNWKPVMEDEAVVCEEAEMVLETIRKDLEKAGYQSIPIIVPAAAVGASHRRYRVFIVAYSEIIRCNVSGKITTSKQGSKTIIADARRTRESGAILADTSYKRCQERHSPACGQGLGQHSRSTDARRTHSAGRPTQPGMGGSAHELSNWLDGRGVNPLDALAEFIAQYPQPALMGQPQYEWEPPRVATGVKNRTARLKALGNAVDPLQVLPVLYGIRIIHDFLVNGGKLK